MKNKWINTTLLLLFLLSGCQKEASTDDPITYDFETLMGKNLPAWKYVRTREDFENLSFFKKVYETNLPYLQQEGQTKIPKIIHFIWIGPQPFPRESIENVRSWIGHHPDWEFKFWTDRNRPLPHPHMQLCMVEPLKLEKLKKFYLHSDNFGEQSDILRLEILLQDGGIYVDHDVTCFKSFAPLNQAYDFYCGMEVPYPTSLSSSVLPTNNILGAKPQHPIVKGCIDWLAQNWKRIGEEYPGKDRDAVITRVAHRTFFALGHIFKQHSNIEANIDIALPSYYFNSPQEKWALYAQHHYKGKWFENASSFEKMARKRLMMLSKKTNKILLAIGIVTGINAIGFAMVFFTIYRVKRKLLS